MRKITIYFFLLCGLVLLCGCSETDPVTPRNWPPPPPVPIVLVDESVKVSAGDYRAWSFSFSVGNELDGDISSDSDVNVWLLSPREYEAFQNSETFHYYSQASRKRTLGFRFAYTVQASGKYYFVLDNTFSWLTSKAVSVNLKLTR